jgi:hypothetical protein
LSQLVEDCCALGDLKRSPALRVLERERVRRADEPAPDALVIQRPDARSVVQGVRIDAEGDVRERRRQTHAQRGRDDAVRAVDVDERLHGDIVRREVSALKMLGAFHEYKRGLVGRMCYKIETSSSQDKR